jgi:hypothetical protein
MNTVAKELNQENFPNLYLVRKNLCNEEDFEEGMRKIDKELRLVDKELDKELVLVDKELDKDLKKIDDDSIFFEILVKLAFEIWSYTKDETIKKEKFVFLEQGSFLRCYKKPGIISIRFNLNEVRKMYSKKEIENNIKNVCSKYPDNKHYRNEKTFCIVFNI